MVGEQVDTDDPEDLRTGKDVQRDGVLPIPCDSNEHRRIINGSKNQVMSKNSIALKPIMINSKMENLNVLESLEFNLVEKSGMWLE